MPTTTLQNVAIRGIVTALPGKAIDIRELPSTFSEPELEKVAQGVGLGRVYRVPAGQTAGDLCIAAAERLLEKLGWERDSIDGIILVTQTPDHALPATACIAQNRLGLGTHALAFDVSMGCSGYVYGLFVSSSFVANQSCKRFILLAGDAISPTLSSEDKSVAVLFGDAGSATALEFEEGAAPLSFILGTDGAGAMNLCIPAGAGREPYSSTTANMQEDGDGNRRSRQNLYMDGFSIMNFTLQRVPALVRSALEMQGWTMEEVDLFLFHQANGFILKNLVKRMKLPQEHVPINIAEYGNTSLTSIPLLLTDMASSLTSGTQRKVALFGFGVGYSWASMTTVLPPLKVMESFSVDAEGKAL